MTGLSGADWEIWYCDTFDRDAPSSVDVRGSGLVPGLSELWARVLIEGVAIGGFSRFWLQRKEGVVEVPESRRDAALRLRSWVFGEQVDAASGYVAAAEPDLLRKIAHAHACLLDQGRDGDWILCSALAARDREDFAGRLDALVPSVPSGARS